MSRPEPATAGSAAAADEIGSVFVSNYPPFSLWSEGHVEEAHAALASPPRPDADFGLYLHIPFCRKRCNFCYFRVFTDKNSDEIGTYLRALAREVEIQSRTPAIRGRRPRFVYFGGGTPSYISADHLRELVGRVRAAIPWDGVEEVTFECEPGTLTRSKLEAVKEVGVTRLSLGIENFDDAVLRENGRAHVSKEIERCLPWIEEIGFDQLNVDLIAGMIGETDEKWRRTVSRTVELAPDSVTVYQLELPFNTRFTKSLQAGELEQPVADWDTKRRWHEQAIEELSRAGYEVSSAYTMVKDKQTCRFLYRNSVWRGCDLLGTGVASFSHVNGTHFQNVDGWGEYLARMADDDEDSPPIGRALPTTADERLTRELILQLKLGRIGTRYFREKFGVDVLERFADPLARLADRGMLEIRGDEVVVSRQGLLRVDMLLPEFYDERYRGARYT